MALTNEMSEQLARDIISFCKKWGLWKEVQIFTGGKCYTDIDGIDHMEYTKIEENVYVRAEPDPDPYLSGYMEIYNHHVEAGEEQTYEYKRCCFSNPEHLLDMTFEGPLYNLLNDGELTVWRENLSDEARKYLLREKMKWDDDAAEFIDHYRGWDPVEYDSFEDYLELEDPPEFDDEILHCNMEDFESAEEFQEYLYKAVSSREAVLEEYYIMEEMKNAGLYSDHDVTAAYVFNQFKEIFTRYGLWFEMGFKWTLTAYRKGEMIW